MIRNGGVRKRFSTLGKRVSRCDRKLCYVPAVISGAEIVAFERKNNLLDTLFTI